MAYFLIAFVALGVMLSLTSTERLMVERAHHSAVITPGTLEGGQFARFAFAMEQYLEANPTVSGTLSPQLAAGQFTAAFLSNVTAWVSPPGTVPRELVCTGTLGPGALQAALQYSEGDAAFGTPTTGGSHWFSATGPTGSAAQPLPNPAPSASTIVFVVDLQP